MRLLLLLLFFASNFRGLSWLLLATSSYANILYVDFGGYAEGDNLYWDSDTHPRAKLRDRHFVCVLLRHRQVAVGALPEWRNAILINILHHHLFRLQAMLVERPGWWAITLC